LFSLYCLQIIGESLVGPYVPQPLGQFSQGDGADSLGGRLQDSHDLASPLHDESLTSVACTGEHVR
jgi:hypothetical protein